MAISVSVTAGTGSTVTLPPYAAGDRFELTYGFEAPDTLGITWPSGWTQLYRHGQSNNNQMATAYRDMVGDEGSSISVTNSAGEDGAWTLRHITGHDPATPPEVGEADSADFSAGPTPPPLSPSWGAEEGTLFGVLCTWRRASANLDSYPAEYTDNRVTTKSSDTTGGGAIAGATRFANVATETPSSFALGSSRTWIAQTIAHRPATGGGGTPDPTDVAFAGTAPLPSLAATVDAEPPAFSASFSGTAPLPSLAAAVGHAPPEFAASFAGVAPLPVLAAEASHTPPGLNVTFAGTAPLPTLAAVVAAEAPEFPATFAGTAPLPVLAAVVGHVPPGQNVGFAGAAPLPQLAATLTRTLPGAVVEFAGSAPLPVLAAALTRTVPQYGASFAGVAPLPLLSAALFNGEFAPTLYLTASRVRMVPALSGAAVLLPALDGEPAMEPALTGTPRLQPRS